MAAEAGARVDVEVGAHVSNDVAARGGADVGARGGAEHDAADGDGREATEVGARVVTGLGVHDPAVRRALMAPPSAPSASVLTKAVVTQLCTLVLFTMSVFSVRPARTSPGGWLAHRAARRYWAAVGGGTGASAGVGVDAIVGTGVGTDVDVGIGAVVGAGVGIGCTAASSATARRVEYDSQRCWVQWPPS